MWVGSTDWGKGGYSLRKGGVVGRSINIQGVMEVVYIITPEKITLCNNAVTAFPL